MSKDLINKLNQLDQLELPNTTKDAVWLEDVIELIETELGDFSNITSKEKCCDTPEEMWNKHSDLDVGTDKEDYRDLTFNFCNNCGQVWNVEFE